MSDYGMTTTDIGVDDLRAGDHPIISEIITVVSGAGVLKRGTPLGRITATGKYKKHSTNNTDGSQTASRVLAEDIDATSADVKAVAYAHGEFRLSDVLALSGASSTLSINLADKGIYLK